MAVIGLGLGLGQPVTLSWVAGAARRELRGTALELRVSGNRLGQTVLPAVVGLIAGTTALGAVLLTVSHPRRQRRSRAPRLLGPWCRGPSAGYAERRSG